ncbi:MAG TPA: hypothetical protein VKP30_28085 [Polyangiaceae bacterium]|nr:hypothetical protein [Polyangiaceae bacterium]
MTSHPYPDVRMLTLLPGDGFVGLQRVSHAEACTSMSNVDIDFGRLLLV